MVSLHLRSPSVRLLNILVENWYRLESQLLTGFLAGLPLLIFGAIVLWYQHSYKKKTRKSIKRAEQFLYKLGGGVSSYFFRILFRSGVEGGQ